MPNTWVTVYNNGVFNEQYLDDRITGGATTGTFATLSFSIEPDHIEWSGSGTFYYQARQAKYTNSYKSIPVDATKIRFTGTFSYNLGRYGNTYFYFPLAVQGGVVIMRNVEGSSATDEPFEVEMDLIDTQWSFMFQTSNISSATYKIYKIELYMPKTYTWQSVPSISGKNGILLLSTIQSVYLNDGEPVNNALESYIDFIDNAKVAVLVDAQIDDPSKVTVKYIVPAGTYEYIKLVYKVGSAPTSITDGTAVDILQADKSVILSGIADGNTYFFKIFTDITESEPYEFTTVKPEPIMGNVFAPNFSTDGRDVLRYDPNKTIHIHHTDSGAIVEDYDVTCGALFDLVYLATPHYTLSNNELILSDADGGYFGWAYDVNGNLRVIPANCSLWFELDIYFSGSATGWIDWHMFNGQDSQVVYWCWDTKYSFHTGIWYNCKVEATVANGIVTYYKYYVDDVIVYQAPASYHMLWVDETNPIPCKYITFKTTAPVRIKNMKIYSEVQ